MTFETSRVKQSADATSNFEVGGDNNDTDERVAKVAADQFVDRDLTMSFVEMMSGNLGEISSRRCIFKKTDQDEWCLIPREKLTDPTDNDQFNSTPANFKNEDEYFSALDSYKGEIDRLEKTFLRDFFTDLDLNIPGTTKIRSENSQKGKAILQQVEVDISRFSKMSVNGRIIYEKEEGNPYGTNDFFAIYQVLLASFENDVNITEMISKLLTQASLGRPIEILTRKYTNNFLKKIVTNAIFSNLQLQTNYRLADGTKTVRYIKVVRIIKLDKKSLKDVLKVDGEIIDVYSPFYRDFKDANSYSVNLANILNSSSGPGSCHIL